MAFTASLRDALMVEIASREAEAVLPALQALSRLHGTVDAE